MFARRRQPLRDWPIDLLAAHVPAAYWRGERRQPTGWDHLFAVVVFHQDPARLPRRVMYQATDFHSFSPWLVLRFGALQYELLAHRLGRIEPMLMGAYSLNTERDALAYARRRAPEADGWCGTTLEGLPALMAMAFVTAIRRLANDVIRGVEP